MSLSASLRVKPNFSFGQAKSSARTSSQGISSTVPASTQAACVVFSFCRGTDFALRRVKYVVFEVRYDAPSALNREPDSYQGPTTALLNDGRPDLFAPTCRRGRHELAGSWRRCGRRRQFQ